MDKLKLIPEYFMTFVGTISQVLHEISTHVNKLITDLQTKILRLPNMGQYLTHAHGAGIATGVFSLAMRNCYVCVPSVPFNTAYTDHYLLKLRRSYALL